MDPIKEAFSKIKSDIDFLRSEISQLRSELMEINSPPSSFSSTSTPNNLFHEAPPTNNQTNNSTEKNKKRGEGGLYQLNLGISTGNQGVPTDKPTNQQTDQHPTISYGNKENGPDEKGPKSIEDFKKASEILHSLDSIKKEIRLKFKRLTTQEMLVFSTLYGLEEQKIENTTYKTLSTILGLSESSIRDYINKLVKKGIPIDKLKQNNKTVLLKISLDLKKITTLDTILKLRDL